MSGFLRLSSFLNILNGFGLSLSYTEKLTGNNHPTIFGL